MNLYKTYKFRMYPNDDQIEKISLFFKAKRLIYNKYIEKMKDNETISGFLHYRYSFENFQNDLKKIRQEYPWLNDIDGCIIRTTLQDVDNAFARFYNGEANYPKYKSYYQSQIYKTICIYHNNRKTKIQSVEIDLLKKTIKLPKLDKIKIAGYRKMEKFEKTILSVTVKKTGKKYYAHVLTREIIEFEFNFKEKKLSSIVGLDLGIKNMVVTSDGVKYPSLNIGRIEEQIRLLQKKLTASELKSKNHEKIALKIQKKYQTITNKRLEAIHFITNDLIKKYDVFVVENLSVKEMLQRNNSSLSNKIQNSAFYEIIKQLERKATLNGKIVIKVDKYFPSSQLCSICGFQNKKMKNISIRNWVCPRCGSNNDRDVNASINIRNEGYKLLQINNN